MSSGAADWEHGVLPNEFLNARPTTYGTRARRADDWAALAEQAGRSDLVELPLHLQEPERHAIEVLPVL